MTYYVSSGTLNPTHSLSFPALSRFTMLLTVFYGTTVLLLSNVSCGGH